jgi:hypothetical protein
MRNAVGGGKALWVKALPIARKAVIWVRALPMVRKAINWFKSLQKLWQVAIVLLTLFLTALFLIIVVVLPLLVIAFSAADALAKPNVVGGTEGDDRLIGTAGRDEMKGGPGKDLFVGGGGDDLIWADADYSSKQNDRVDAGEGDDYVRTTDKEKDVVDCGPGNDEADVDHMDETTNCEAVQRKRPPTEKERRQEEREEWDSTRKALEEVYGGL